MESFYLSPSEGSFATPKISFDLNTFVFDIEGESFIENTDAFYAPVVGWLEEFIDHYAEKIVFNFRFQYYNSSSSKSILRILKILKKYKETGQMADINWYFPEGNDDLEQEGKDFIELLNMPFRILIM